MINWKWKSYLLICTYPFAPIDSMIASSWGLGLGFWGGFLPNFKPLLDSATICNVRKYNEFYPYFEVKCINNIPIFIHWVQRIKYL